MQHICNLVIGCMFTVIKLCRPANTYFREGQTLIGCLHHSTSHGERAFYFSYCWWDLSRRLNKWGHVFTLLFAVVCSSPTYSFSSYTSRASLQSIQGRSTHAQEGFLCLKSLSKIMFTGGRFRVIPGNNRTTEECNSGLLVLDYSTDREANPIASDYFSR